MQLVGTIAVVISVLVLAYQARELAGHTRVANEVAGTQAHRDLLVMNTNSVGNVFIQYPHLYAHFWDETSETPSASDAVRLTMIAENLATWFEAGIVTSDQLRAYVHDIGDWRGVAAGQLASSTPFRSTVRDRPGLWPPLDPILAD